LVPNRIGNLYISPRYLCFEATVLGKREREREKERDKGKRKINKEK